MPVRDVNESRSRRVSKKILGLKKKFLDEKFLDEKFALEQMWALSVFERDAMSLFFAGGWCLITPPTPSHTSWVCLPDAFVYLTPLI